MTGLDDLGLYNHGESVESTSDERFDSINPATGEVLCRVPQANASEVQRAVDSSLDAFAEWSQMTGAERVRILNRAAAILRERNDDLARLEVLDTGKPIELTPVTRIELAGGVD